MEKDIAYALKIFNINSKTAAQKKLGEQFISFVKIFNIPFDVNQAFSFDTLGKQKTKLFTKRFIKICKEFLEAQTEHIKIEFVNNLIILANNV